MTWRTPVAALLVAIVLSLPSVALAKSAVLDEFAVAGWIGRAYANERQEFTHCIVSADYKSGVWLAFVLDDDYEIHARLFDDRWRLPEREVFPVRALVDGFDLGRFEAVAISRDGIQLTFGNAMDILEVLKRGRRLEIQAARGTFGFHLEGTMKSLTTLRACVDRFRGGTAAANPFSATNPAPPPSAQRDGSNPFAPPGPQVSASASRPLPASGSHGTLKDQETAAAILEEAGFRDFQFIDITDEEHLVAKWKGDAWFGSIKTLRTDEPVTKVVVEIMSIAARDCRGRYSSAMRPVVVPEAVEALEGIGQCSADADGWTYAVVMIRDAEAREDLLTLQNWVREHASDAAKEAGRKLGTAINVLMDR